MKHVGIIAEYNPFHNGHFYQISQIKNQFPGKKIIAVMSGNFVQRGEPAIFNKYLRTQSALSAGIDCIFELPSIYATASAEHFASAGVLALYKTGVVDTLCFGAENDDIDLFYKIAGVLLEEPAEFQILLHQHLKEGNSFPKARGYAISQYLQDPDILSFIQSPNNILGIEYTKAVLKYNLPLKIFIIKREVSDYHSTSIDNSICSATALRSHIKSNGIDSIQHTIPHCSWNTIIDSPHCNPLYSDHFYSLIQYSLWDKKGTYENYLDINHELANKLSAIQSFPSTYDELIMSLSGKNITQSRIRHALLNILLSITQEDMEICKKNDYITYLRLLGFRKESGHILKDMKTSSTITILNKIANAHKSLDDTSQQFFNQDLNIAKLYTQVYNSVYTTHLASEFEHSVIIVDNKS